MNLLLAVALALNSGMLVSTDWLAKKPAGVTVVHVAQNAAAFEAGHIPGARFLPVSAVAARRGLVSNELPPVDEIDAALEAAGIGDSGRIVLYSDDPLLAARAFFALDYLGHGNRAALLDGGFGKWKAEGLPVEAGQAAAREARFTPRIDEKRLMTIEALKPLAGTRSVSLVVARPPAQFTGSDPSDTVSRPGHIPGAKSIFWKTLLAADGTLLPPERLREIHTAAGIDPRRRAISYCRSGVQASMSHFVLRYLGYDAAMYDGSYSEWSGDSGTRIE